MKTFKGKVSVFNGKYWLDYGYSALKASKIHTAAHVAAENAIALARKTHPRMRAIKVIVELEEKHFITKEEKDDVIK